MIYALRDRGLALEQSHAYEQTRIFQTAARQARLLGEWAAPLLANADHAAYVSDIVAMALAGASQVDLAARLRHDFDAAGQTIAEVELLHRMHDLLAQAQRDVTA